MGYRFGGVDWDWDLLCQVLMCFFGDGNAAQEKDRW